MGEKLIFMWSRDQCSTKREKRLHFSVRLGFGMGLGLGYDLCMVLVRVRVWARVRVWIRNQGTRAAKAMSRDCSLASDLVKASIVL